MADIVRRLNAHGEECYGLFREAKEEIESLRVKLAEESARSVEYTERSLQVLEMNAKLMGVIEAATSHIAMLQGLIKAGVESCPGTSPTLQ